MRKEFTSAIIAAIVVAVLTAAGTTTAINLLVAYRQSQS